MGPGGGGHRGPSGWWMSIPASHRSLDPSPLLCNLYGGGGDRSLYIIGFRTCSYICIFIYSSEVSTRICAQLFSGQLMRLDFKVYSVLFTLIFMV